MPRFNVTCRGMLDQRTVDRLVESGVYFTRGGPTLPESKRLRHHLIVEASDEGDAADRARKAVEDAGGDGFDIDVGSQHRD